VCWELLKILRSDTNDLAVRGYHTTITPVDLPPWLPVDVVRTLLRIFRNRLREELDTMMTTYAEDKARDTVMPPVVQQHRRNPSLQSDSGFSNASQTSDTSGRHDIPYYEPQNGS
jgi:hypothetical protein